MPSGFIRSVAAIGFLCCSVRAATIQIVPIRSTGPFELSSNTIAISPGKQRLFFEITLADWGPHGLHVLQVGLDAALSTADPSQPALAVELCSDAATCRQAFGDAPGCVSLCLGGGRAHQFCETPGGCPQGQCVGQCEPVSVDTSRPDFVFAGQSTLAAVSYAGAVVFGALPLSGVDPLDPGTPRYIASLVVDVPDGWIGVRTLGFNDDPNSTFVVVGPPEAAVPLTLVPALIVLRCDLDADCEDGDPCTSGTCDTSVNQCSFTPTYDEALFCCDHDTGELQPIEDDDNECTIDRCVSSNTTHTFSPFGAECGEEVATACSAPDTCNGFGFCRANHKPAGVPCGPPRTGVCGSASVCDGLGQCVERFAPPLTPCGVSGLGTICGGDFCDGAGNCILQFAPAGNRCRDQQSGSCDLPDECDGAGNCVELARPPGTACGQSVNTACNRPDTCDGLGHCQSNLAPVGTACGSTTNTTCNRPDTCDGLGTCRSNIVSAGTPCGSPDSSACDDPDLCDGQGGCLKNHRSVGTPCGDSAASACDQPDSCDALGTCNANRKPNGTACDDGLFCNGAEVCLDGNCLAGSPPCNPTLCREATQTCVPSNLVYQPFPTDQSTLWRESHNEIRLRPRSGPLPASKPATGEMLIQEMLPGGLYGPDLSPGFSVTLINAGLFGEPELLVREQTPSLQNRKWYAVRAPNGWPAGTAPILFQFAVQVGDATGEGFVVANDLAAINARVPRVQIDAASIRTDITGDGKVNMADVAAAYRRVPSIRVSKPAGH